MGILRSLLGKESNNKQDKSPKEGRTKKDECPYCGYHLEKRPKRASKCPNCDQKIYVHKPYLMTERERDLTEWAIRLEGLNITRRDIDKHQVELAKQFGLTPAMNDVIWRVLNSVIASNPGWGISRIAYHEMARLVSIEGKDPAPYLQEAAKQDLLSFKDMEMVTYVKVNTCNDELVCPKCRELEMRNILLEDALQHLPVPNECEREEGCRCWYSAVFD